MKRYKLMFIALALIVVLSACNKKPNNNESTDNNISEDNSSSDADNAAGQNVIYHAPDGVYIDFGCLLDEGDEVTVEKVEPALIDEGVKIYAYEITLSSGQPRGAIEIVIPYDDEGLNKDEELYSVCGKYFNKESNQWEDVFYTVDTEANEVHIFTDHLSLFSVFTFSNQKKRDEYISEVNTYGLALSTEQALKILEAYGRHGDSWQADVVGAFLDASGSFTGYLLTNTHTLLSLGEVYDNWVSKPIQESMTALGISTACAQLAYEIYNNGFNSKETATTALKSTLNIAINFATPSIKLAYFGVGILDIALTKVQTFAIAEKYRSTRNMYDAYYKRKENQRSFTDWYNLFESIYKKNKDRPQEALDMMKKEIDRYVNEYWTVAATDWESWIDSYDKNGNTSKYPWPGESDRKNISAIHKKNIYDTLLALFNNMCRNIYLDAMIQRQNEYEKYAANYNQQYSIDIRELIASDKKATWADYYFRLAPLSSYTDPSSWTGRLDSEGSGRITFTLIAHQKAGFPMTLELYHTMEDIQRGNKVYSLRLNRFTNREMTVNLSPRITDEADDIEDEDVPPIEDNAPNEDTPDISSNKEDPPKEDPPKDNPPKDDSSKDNKPKDDSPKDNKPKDDSTKDDQSMGNPPEDDQAKDGSSKNKPPVQVDNPWYDITITSLDPERPNAFGGWYAILAYPKDMELNLKSMYGPFNYRGECTLYIQKADYEALENPSEIWLYITEDDLLNGRKPDVRAKFSISSGSYSGKRDGESVYSILVKARPPAQMKDPLDAINGYYSAYMEYSEMYIPGEGMMEINQKQSYTPYERPSGEAWLHYNGPSLTYKSMQDPNLTEYVLDKLSDYRYELEYVTEGGSIIKHSIIIYSGGDSAQYTYSSETEDGSRYLSRYYMYRDYRDNE